MLCQINKALIPLKLYYFYYMGGLACIIPFMPMFAYKLGFTAGELAVIYGILPFVGLLSKPIVGIIGDTLSAHRLILLIALVIQGVFTFIVYYLPPMPAVEVPVHLTCNQNSATLDLSTNASAVFCNEANTTIIACSFKDPDPYVYKALNISSVAMPLNFSLVADANANFSESKVLVTLSYLGQTRRTCEDSISSNNCSAQLCQGSKVHQDFVRFTSQFWLFLIVMMIGRVGYTAVYTMGDSVAFDLISQQKTAISYGSQRVFGSFGWASACLIVGILMDSFTEGQRQNDDFAPAFYGFIVLLSCAMVTAWFLRPSENIRSTQLLKNVAKLFEDVEFVTFSIGTFLVGMLTGLLYTFEFIYMDEELGAPKLLMGLSQLAVCFAEAPFMFLSSWIISHMGHHGAMAAALGSFSLRFVGYSLIGSQKWWILALELFHGPGFGLFYTNMATFANNVAPTGAVATMQGVLGGIYDGFGIALGGLVGGTIYYRFGGRVAWRSFGLAAGVAALLYLGVTFYFQRRRRRLLSQNQENSGSMQNVVTTGYETPIPPDTPSEKERLTA